MRTIAGTDCNGKEMRESSKKISFMSTFTARLTQTVTVGCFRESLCCAPLHWRAGLRDISFQIKQPETKHSSRVEGLYKDFILVPVLTRPLLRRICWSAKHLVRSQKVFLCREDAKYENYKKVGNFPPFLLTPGQKLLENKFFLL